jgi:Major intrinsic protein
MGNRTFAHFSNVSGDPGRTADRRCERRHPDRWANPQSAGKSNRGHMNPAISLAMWRLGAFPGAGVIPYVIAQLLGSVLGVLVARAVWGPVVAEPSIAYAVLADCNRPTDQYHCHGAHLICVGRSTSGRLRRIESEDLFRSRPITLCKIKLMRPCDTANA